MATATGATAVSERRGRRLLFRWKIERLLDWAEPIIKAVCRQVWAELHPRGLEIEDLFQEGRIEVYLAARRILSARDPEALTATIVRRRAIRAVHSLSDRYPKPHLDASADETDAAEAEPDRMTAA